MNKNLPVYFSKQDGDLWLTEEEREDLKISYRIKEILFEGQSEFQHVMVLDSYSFGRMLVLDGIVQTTSIDGYIYNEMISHVPLCIHPEPKKILIIGGGDCGAAKEVCKYAVVDQVDMVEIDKLVVEVCQHHLPEVSGPLADSRVQFIYDDGVNFAENKENEYDVVIVDSSDPIGPAKSLFEKSFYQSIHKSLKADGLMVCQSQSPIFHQEVMQQTYQRIGELFHFVKLYTAVVPTYPGGLWSFTVGSKNYINPDPARLKDKETHYVNKDIIERCFSLPQFMIEQYPPFENN
ncbi:spermidine synthase [Desulfosporosinus orientis DSM 765]|uniref:Polyamine aminopropyltransferase n=1 Tax=Desulfosporosinus orientis (strain ATCC 19365 / DSM 765 / NCIMB 8382 / VKM B-1628 / Singapore I) TaxID=768706 RepID=G7W575_DESOD|nr:polyamine aminopropyltransferase [Desulfosporosinus orientis]AET66091.1 spermidine synthase [Desulfosporosinus orientis DSM 765]